MGAAWLVPAWSEHVLASGSYIYGSGIERSARYKGLDVQTHLEESSEVVGQYWDSYGLVTVHRDQNETLELRVNGKTDASTGKGDMATQIFLGHVPLLHHDDPKRALVIGLGGGFTAAAAARHQSLEQIDCIELSPGVAQAARDHFGPYNGNVLGDPRVKLTIGDGRHAVRYAREPYDVIVSEPSNLWLSGMATLFTRDFFEEAKDRLASRGIMCQ